MYNKRKISAEMENRVMNNVLLLNIKHTDELRDHNWKNVSIKKYSNNPPGCE